jgi:hypothetical protein
MSKNVLYKHFPKCYQLFNLEDLSKEHVDVIWNPISNEGEIKFCYVYKGLYVLFCGRILKRKEVYKIYTRLKGFKEMLEVDNDTILDERIPGFDPIKFIIKMYDLRKIIISANMNA